jgi:phosphotransferase system enzyme I (PtsI)
LSRLAHKPEVVLNGIAASPGIAMGRVLVFTRRDLSVPFRQLEAHEAEGEKKRLEEAIGLARDQLMRTRDDVAADMGESYGRIFDAHIMILEDKGTLAQVLEKIEAGYNAEFAFNAVFSMHERLLWEKGDLYIKDRAGDIRDVRRRVLSNLLGAVHAPGDLSNLDEEVIVIAHDLSPADTAQMRKEKVMGFATDIGGRTSHTAIMARSLEIPAVVALDDVTTRTSDGDFVILDGNRGRLTISPSEETRAKYAEEVERYRSFTLGLLRFKDLPATTIDGHTVTLSANIELHDEVESVLEHGAQGIGLYRTEFIYIGREGLPSEDEQFHIYKDVASRLAPDPVIIRTMDLGGDKFLSAFESPKEINPYLGWRGIRFCLARKDIFKTQLRAILRATPHGDVKVMYPMISSLDELLEANQVLDEAKRELRDEGLDFDEKCDVGIMVETPAAVMIARELAAHVDFFSIGSNDLIQYALAADRGNEKVAYLYQPLHPAVLRFIDETIRVGKESGIWVGLCGEMSSDVVCAFVLIGLGIDELSTSPYVVPEIKEKVRSIYFSEAEKTARHVLTLKTASEVERAVLEKMERDMPELLL